VAITWVMNGSMHASSGDASSGGSLQGQVAHVVDNVIDGADVHGRFFFVMSQLGMEQDLSFSEQLNGIDTVEIKFIP
jgi:hypothetical protein